jgi:hypothetical protein
LSTTFFYVKIRFGNKSDSKPIKTTCAHHKDMEIEISTFTATQGIRDSSRYHLLPNKMNKQKIQNYDLHEVCCEIRQLNGFMTQAKSEFYHFKRHRRGIVKRNNC